MTIPLMILAIVLVAGCMGSAPIEVAPDTETEGQTGVGGQSGNVTVSITSTGFTPNRATIAAGTTVVWVNDDTAPHWVASARHPTHDLYPGGAYDAPGTFQGSRACAGEGETKAGAFDACHSLAPGESYSFTFTQTGTWNYHDHLNPTVFGTIMVE